MQPCPAVAPYAPSAPAREDEPGPSRRQVRCPAPRDVACGGAAPCAAEGGREGGAGGRPGAAGCALRARGPGLAAPGAASRGGAAASPPSGGGGRGRRGSHLLIQSLRWLERGAAGAEGSSSAEGSGAAAGPHHVGGRGRQLGAGGCEVRQRRAGGLLPFPPAGGTCRRGPWRRPARPGPSPRCRRLCGDGDGDGSARPSPVKICRLVKRGLGRIYLFIYWGEAPFNSLQSPPQVVPVCVPALLWKSGVNLWISAP